MDKKTAIVIGASSGIGLATAILLQHSGYYVTNISRNVPSQEDIDAIDFAKFGMTAPAFSWGKKDKTQTKPANSTGFDSGSVKEIKSVLADVSHAGEIEKAIEQAVGTRPLDVLVFSAGCSMAAPIEFAAEKDYRYLFEVNFFAAVRALTTAVPLMKRGGRIILVSSVGATLPLVFDSFYSCSKAALSMFARCADSELRKKNIRVTAVEPAGVCTEFTFKRNVYGKELSGEYASDMEAAMDNLAQIEQDGLDAEAVAKKIVQLTLKKNPPSVAAVGAHSHAISTVTKLLPTKLVDKINHKISLDN